MLTAREARELMNRRPVMEVLDLIEEAAKKGQSEITYLVMTLEGNLFRDEESVRYYGKYSDIEDDLLPLGYNVDLETTGDHTITYYWMHVSW